MMMMAVKNRRQHLLAGVCGVVLWSSPVLAAETQDSTPDDGTALELGDVVVSASKPLVPATVPAVVKTLDKQEIDQTVNAVTSAETIKYQPSIVVRERYIGDRNGILSMRTNGTTSSAQTAVYADEMLISNYLGNSYGYPPRWGMVSPEEIERVNIIYGPFSVLYPGNSIGGVVVLETKVPDKTEFHGSAQLIQQSYDLYNSKKTVTGDHLTASAAGKVSDRLHIRLGADHLDNQGQPMSFATATATTTGTGQAVTGYAQDTSEKGVNRYVFGATSIDHSIQDNGKLKLIYDVTPTLKATYQVGLWSNDSDTSVQSYLTDANGKPLYNGKVNIGGKVYSVSMNPSQSDSLHLMNGVALKQDVGGTFDWAVDASLYSYLTDETRAATNYGNSSVGTITSMNGSGWASANVGGIWRPDGNRQSRHEVSVGYHVDQYSLDQTVSNTLEWQKGTESSFKSSSEGKTRTQALYVQDAWRVHPDWTLTVGGRGERWEAFDGSNHSAASDANYENRSATTFSPKAALAYQSSPDWSHRLSVGRAYRFPTVTEMFQQITSGSTIITGNPDLQPERAWAYDFTNEYAVSDGTWRVSLFQENIHSALISQTNTTLNTTTYQNVESLRMRGIETAFTQNGVVWDQLDLSGSVTYTDSEILKNPTNLTTEGRRVPRIPEWRASLTATWHQDDDLSYSGGLRYASASYSNLDNSDLNHGVYGGNSEYLIADAKVNYKLTDWVTLNGGIDNAFATRAYVYHPYPSTTLFAGVKVDY